MSTPAPTGGGTTTTGSSNSTAPVSGQSAINALVNPAANLSKAPGTQTSTSGPPAWAVPYLQGAMGSAQSAFSGGAGSVSPFTPTQLSGMSALTNYANSGANGLIPQMDASESFLDNPNLLNPNSNPYLASSVNAAISPITQNFQDSVMPGINTSAEQNGVFGGSRQGIAQGLASNSYLQDVANTSSSMYSNAYNTGLQTMLSANNAMPGVIAAGELPGQILEGVGQEQQAQNQAESNQPYTQLQDYASILSMLLGGAGTTGTETGSAPSGLQNALAGGSALAGILSLFMGSETGGDGGTG